MKPIWESKTFWLAVIPIVVGVLNWVQGNLADGVPLTIYGLLAVVLRLITKEPVSLLGK